MAKQLNLKLDPKSPEFRWAQAQSNKTLSLKHLIDLAIRNYGYEDLIKISLSQVAKTQKLSLGDITSSTTSDEAQLKRKKSNFNDLTESKHEVEGRKEVNQQNKNTKIESKEKTQKPSQSPKKVSHNDTDNDLLNDAGLS
ncbi:hypothetical protein AAA439_11870 [Lactobacillus crispatus]|uniref:Uncharacterized protein n=1 Tax=Lactobacillus crispatus FB077-07 TaxID=883092 RepID=K1MD63_9LACO|nr:hypothetical protein [Lactobacillus crispatus]CPR74113.1 Uncharacterised protein [Chlamydia trachomatis]EKB62167.1 hypothetical protein HMPREF9249_02390 [Lactobacillus crispatus FB077-07]KWX56379.1 hypothetical protein AEL94_10700 [Lactobacillus crispatus]MCT7731255.1 hypothetical protein [Lactobacillus crispatus]MCT7816876.1 hypothetical protein [Lactobacillus crispatus]